jgi:hypothetical protein
MVISLSDQTWRNLRPKRWPKDLSLNPPLESILSSHHQQRVILVHTGKCGGESILQALRLFYGNSVAIFQYHCFDANLLIRELLCELASDGTSPLTIYVATRDPITRWISSFNWVLHKRFLSKGRERRGGYHKYPDIQHLVDGISAGDTGACEFGRTGHMGMGISWYLPYETAVKLPASNLHVIRQESLEADVNLAFATVGRHPEGISSQPPVLIARTKGDFKKLYPGGVFKDASCLSGDSLLRLKEYLADDYRVNEFLFSFLPTSPIIA